MPMSCDILKIEYFLRPGTIIVIDGRTSNYRFLKNNLQRKWKSFDDYEHDQYFLILEEFLIQYSFNVLFIHHLA